MKFRFSFPSKWWNQCVHLLDPLHKLGLRMLTQAPSRPPIGWALPSKINILEALVHLVLTEPTIMQFMTKLQTIESSLNLRFEVSACR